MKYHVWVNNCDFGVIEARNEQHARDKAAQMAGYNSERHMEKMLEQSSEFEVEEFSDNSETF